MLVRMRREWEPEELIACWTLLDSDRRLLANKSGATRLGFVALLKFFELEGGFRASMPSCRQQRSRTSQVR
jgi:hypothetical protein